ncbi:MAG: ABC transporter permease subunit [Ectothiorhodospiraceae bacterium]|nr:ABC transporter permease subunit [Ectothiorhodospiraceae bacterium]
MVTRSLLRPLLDAIVLVAVVTLAWQGLYEYAGDVALTPPLETVSLALDLLGSARFWPHVRETGLAVAQGLAIAVLGGLSIGLTLGIHRLSGEVAEPILVALYSIPKITLYPVILLIFGIGMPAKVAFGAIHGIIPIIIFSMNAMRNIHPVYLKTARVMRLGPLPLATRVLLPAALPEVFTGLRVGFALTLVGTLMGEMFGSQRGIGFMLMRAMGSHDMATIMSVTLLLVLFATLVSVALLVVDRRLHRFG